jgi:ribosomal protein S18 acetylase RimI-like enzyme
VNGKVPAGVTLVAGGAELLDRIAPLWHELRSHHALLDPTWRDGLLATQFHERKAGLITKSSGGGAMLVLHASTSERSEVVGYCVTTVTPGGDGEIDSLFVVPSHRRRGIGEAMMLRSMQWLAERGAKSIAVEVMAGNADALRLYERWGFRARTVRMLHVPPSDGA